MEGLGLGLWLGRGIKHSQITISYCSKKINLNPNWLLYFHSSNYAKVSLLQTQLIEKALLCNFIELQKKGAIITVRFVHGESCS